ncbi:MAG TPA: hypothetical protein PK253_08695 [Spirochaetota bacterium]|nr:hypothetical protein [Spirochaetota bacterium]
MSVIILLRKKTYPFLTGVMSGILMLCGTALFAQDAGSRASYTRGGWAGAKYVAMGRAAEVIVDDVYAIYWNPAGLAGLKERERLSTEEIQRRAREGSVGSISEEDLVRFSDDTATRTVFQIGISAAKLDIEREAGFGGIAFNLFGGVMGMGLYSIQSKDIEARDESGNLMGKLDYSGSVGYLSYAWTSGISSIGFSLKGLYEKVGDVGYYGGGVDIGTQVDVIPFLRVGFVVMDIGTGLKPDKQYENIENEYDFGSPSLKLSMALTSRQSDFILAFSIVRKLEQEEYDLNVGISYQLIKNMAVYVGMNDTEFSSGLSMKVWGLEVAYAFSYDNIDAGYNNIVSVTLDF